MSETFGDKASQAIEKYWPKIEEKFRDGILHLGDEKLNDKDLIKSILNRAYQILPLPVRFFVSQDTLGKYLEPKIEIMALKARQAKIQNLMEKEEIEDDVLDKLIVQKLEIDLEIGAIEARQQPCADIEQINRNLEVLKNSLRESSPQLAMNPSDESGANEPTETVPKLEKTMEPSTELH